jgi:AraC family transcriptional activator of pobA
MDSARNLLHYSNMASIPVYALYGENEGPAGPDWLHWETIQSRSRLYGYEIAPHRHEQFFQLLVITAGRAHAVLDGTEIDLAPPAVVVVPALTVHGYRFSHDVDGVVLTLMERDVAELGLAFPNAATVDVDDGVRTEVDALIAEAGRSGAGHEKALRARMTLLLIALHRAASETTDNEAMADPARRHAQVFRTLVDRKFRETRRIADYAAAIGISTTHLNRVCRQVLGASALEMIERRIALEARRQLRFSDLSVKQIASDLGYDDPAYFSRFVSRTLGLPPSAFRERSRQH